MSALTDTFLADIAGLDPELEKVRLDTLAYWSEETPPLTIAYADIGRAIVQHHDRFDADMRRNIYARIEEGMVSPDELLRSAVATGMIEAMSGRAGRLGTWETIRAFFGPASLYHADWWHNG
jgi:hypothetical protein